MLLVVVLAITHSRAGSLVCKFTNEVLATCCCAQEQTSSVPAVERPCCCRTMVVGELPQANAIDSDETAPLAPSSELLALCNAPARPMTSSIRTRLYPRETGPPPSAPERLARLQVFHL